MIIDGISTEPVVSLTAFIVGAIVLMLAISAAADLLTYMQRKKKSPRDCGNNPAGRHTLQRYYNTRDRGA